MTNAAGNGIIYDPDAFDWGDDAFTIASWNELIIYEMHVGTFNVKEEGQPGTLDMPLKNFLIFGNLGINTIEVMPIMEFSGDFSWGYNPSHPFAVESIYGGPDAFKRLVKAAHEHGIAVIVDVVYNHLALPISICGGLTAGAKTRKGESTFTRSPFEQHPGARRVLITAGRGAPLPVR